MNSVMENYLIFILLVTLTLKDPHRYQVVLGLCYTNKASVLAVEDAQLTLKQLCSIFTSEVILLCVFELQFLQGYTGEREGVIQCFMTGPGT